MEKLKKANLYRNELIPIRGKLVERYNQCLLKLGFTPTTLNAFSIDGIGWSPEIAAEKNELFYLNHGDANSHGIILTPLQKGTAIYNPFYSFDKELMTKVFKKHNDCINDITKDAAICIDFDQNIPTFYEPLDVLKYKNITIKFHLINNLHQAKATQLALIEEFYYDQNFIDEDIHQKILVSAKKYGDLRERNLDLEDIVFTTDSFYTKAFGGVFVLRDFVKPILIFENIDVYKKAIKETVLDVLIYHISQNELIDKLKNHIIIELDLEAVTTQKRHERIQKFIFSGFLKNTEHPVQNILSDPILFKSYLNKIDIAARKKVMGVSLFLEKQKTVNHLLPKEIIDLEMLVALHKPHSSLKASHQDLIWTLLTKIAPKDVLFLYWYDLSEFYNIFSALENTTQDWVIATILDEF